MKKILFSTIFILLFCGLSATAQTIYVSQSGNDGGDGSQGSPYKTIQKACNMVNAGDTVLVSPGVYYESVKMTRGGTSQNPVTLKADGDVIITGANEGIRKNTTVWTLEDPSLGLYSIPLDLGNPPTSGSYPYYPARVLCDGINLQPYFNLSTLNQFVLNEGNSKYSSLATDKGAAIGSSSPGSYLKGPEQGYFFDCIGKKLYVRLYEDGRYTPENTSNDPNMHTMAIAPTLYHKAPGTNYSGWRGTAIGDGSYNIGIDIQGSAHIVIDGFTLETPGVAGVYIRSNNVVVKNVNFSGCRAGVVGGAKYTNDVFVTENVTVSDCNYNQFPSFEEAEELIYNYYDNSTVNANKFFWWQKKGVDANTNIYSWLDYEAGGLVGRMGRNWTIENNYIYSAFDGFSYYAFTPYTNSNTSREVPAENIIIRNNRFEKCVDNSIELENHARNISIYKNEFIDNYMTISVQPMDGLPWPTNIYIYDNIITQNKYLSRMWLTKAKYASAWLKFGTSEDQWSWTNLTGISKEDIDFTEGGSTDGINIFNNTVITPYGNFFENVGKQAMRYNGLKIQNNIFQTQLTGKIENYNGVTMKSNVLVPSEYSIEFFSGKPNYNGYFSNHIDFLNLNDDFTLSKTSPLRHLGSKINGFKQKGCDIGAFQYGDAYDAGIQNNN